MFSAFASRIARLGRSTTPSKRNRSSSRLSFSELDQRVLPATNLGIANNYGVFVLHDVNLFYSDVQAAVAVGGNATFNGYSVGDRLGNSYGTKDSLVVGGNLDFTNGQVNGGNVAYGGTGTFSMFGIPNGTTRHDSPINFGAASTELLGISDAFAALPGTGTVSEQVRHDHPDRQQGRSERFNISAPLLTNASDLVINAPAGSRIVNITGTTARMQYMGYHLNGPSQDDVVLNFHDATSVPCGHRHLW